MAKPQNLSLEAACNEERFLGEHDKFCAESVESLLDFVISKLGKDIEALTSSFVPHQTHYSILAGVQKVSIPMKTTDGTRTSIVAICHRDTRAVEPHKLFRQLKVKPGTVPVCHFLGSGTISWVPRNNKLNAAY
ncbi:embryonic abundant protein VF30.1-like [Neltuma alba]|uniref:embryonic abundant protein VF30.1-like n=1 Tax=Neltuma alba TaxID=207710 RepID=UPI0010A40C95|nr:embryonic abundant protein VF30.1-like [Prosopis alba]